MKETERSRVGLEKIHSMDHGSLYFSITSADEVHHLKYREWWESCGLTGETFECSCGFYSTEHPGNGCWQQGHDEKARHRGFDATHARLTITALEEAVRLDIGYPAQWRGLAMLAISDLGKKKGSMGLIKRATRIARSFGRPK